MIDVSFYYPYQANARFDLEYYRNQHMKLVTDRLGAACKGSNVRVGIAGRQAEEPPAFIASGHLLFDSIEAFQRSFTPHAAEFRADVANYTDIVATMVISELV